MRHSIVYSNRGVRRTGDRRAGGHRNSCVMEVGMRENAMTEERFWFLYALAYLLANVMGLVAVWLEGGL